MARFHRALGSDPPAGKERFVREDHPDLLRPLLEELRPLCREESERAALHFLERQLELVRSELDEGLYASLPHAVIHGDVHPGNVAFENSKVAAFYDFDYMSWQARVRDVCDALMFFAAARPQPLDVDDIRSLTQSYRLELEACRRLIAGYEEISSLSDLEWRGLPLLLRSQWCQIRLRGSRKRPPDEKLAFATHDF